MLASAPAAAQTATISASGNCGGTPANCGTSGDRDTTWPGLQVDEGDILTFTSTVSPAVTDGLVLVDWRLSGNARNTDDLRRSNGNPLSPSHDIITGNLDDNYNAGSNPSGSDVATMLVYNDSVMEGDETPTLRIHAVVSTGASTYVAGVPSSVTVTIRGTDSAPDFGSGSVSNKTYIACLAITDF